MVKEIRILVIYLSLYIRKDTCLSSYTLHLRDQVKTGTQEDRINFIQTAVLMPVLIHTGRQQCEKDSSASLSQQLPNLKIRIFTFKI